MSIKCIMSTEGQVGMTSKRTIPTCIYRVIRFVVSQGFSLTSLKFNCRTKRDLLLPNSCFKLGYASTTQAIYNT